MREEGLVLFYRLHNISTSNLRMRHKLTGRA